MQATVHKFCFQACIQESELLGLELEQLCSRDVDLGLEEGEVAVGRGSGLRLVLFEGA